MATTTTSTSLSEAADEIITVGNQLYQIMNGGADETVETDNGVVPTIRRALIHNFYFLSPEDWESGSTETVFNQLRLYTDSDGESILYFAPAATSANPIAMGASPIGDSNWEPSPWHMATDEQCLAGSGFGAVSATELKTALDQFGGFGTAHEYTGDLDELSISGSFITTSATTNVPSSSYTFSIFSVVSPTDSNDRTQLALMIGSKYVYTRTRNSDGWSDWSLAASSSGASMLQLSQQIVADVAIDSGNNALTINPVIDEDVTVTVPEDSLFVILGGVVSDE